MKIRNYLQIVALMGFTAILPMAAQAQTASPTASATSKSTTVDMTEAEVRKVDKDNQKITLKHGEIKNLDMPPMTMVFRVNDPSFIDKVKPGDKVRFHASNEDGKLTVTEIQVTK